MPFGVNKIQMFGLRPCFWSSMPISTAVTWGGARVFIRHVTLSTESPEACRYYAGYFFGFVRLFRQNCCIKSH